MTLEQQQSALFALDQAQLRSPYNLYEQWRAQGDVLYLRDQDIFVVTRHELIKAVNRQPNLFSSQNPLGPSSQAAAEVIAGALAEYPEDDVNRAHTVLSRGNVLFTADPPDHTRHRRLLNAALRRSAIERIRDDIVQISRQAIASVDRGVALDLVAELAVPVPIHCLAALLGMSREHSQDFYRWATAINASIGSSMSPDRVRQVIDDQMDFWAFFEAEMVSREKAPGHDLLSAIATAKSSVDAPLSLAEKVGFCSQLIGAGADTTTKLIGFAARALATDEVLQDKLRKSPDLIASFAEEVLRLEPPVQGMFRVATADTALGDVEIPQGSMVWLLYACGNRDQSAFACPNEVDLHRENPAGHLSFGSGPHVCIGANLAREVARTLLTELLAQTSRITLVSSEADPAVIPSYVMHGLASLTVELH